MDVALMPLELRSASVNVVTFIPAPNALSWSQKCATNLGNDEISTVGLPITAATARSTSIARPIRGLGSDAFQTRSP